MSRNTNRYSRSSSTLPHVFFTGIRKGKVVCVCLWVCVHTPSQGSIACSVDIQIYESPRRRLPLPSADCMTWNANLPLFVMIFADKSLRSRETRFGSRKERHKWQHWWMTEPSGWLQCVQLVIKYALRIWIGLKIDARIDCLSGSNDFLLSIRSVCFLLSHFYLFIWIRFKIYVMVCLLISFFSFSLTLFRLL